MLGLGEVLQKTKINNLISLYLPGMLGTPNMVPYSATKFALTGFMEGLHYELKNDKVYLSGFDLCPLFTLLTTLYLTNHCRLR